MGQTLLPWLVAISAVIRAEGNFPTSSGLTKHTLYQGCQKTAHQLQNVHTSGQAVGGLGKHSIACFPKLSMVGVTAKQQIDK